MKKILIIVLVIIALGFSIFKLFKKDDLSNDRAERDKNGRYLTIINETNQIINRRDGRESDRQGVAVHRGLRRALHEVRSRD